LCHGQTLPGLLLLLGDTFVLGYSKTASNVAQRLKKTAGLGWGEKSLCYREQHRIKGSVFPKI
jgi:hypothetical protein